MTTLREAAEQALEALESYGWSGYIKHEHPKRHANGKSAITALRAALAEQAEPVAWRYKPMVGAPWSLTDDGYYVSCKRDHGYIVQPLYTAPAAPPAPAAPQPPAWQPIATAPKDACTVLLSDGEIVGEGFWHDGSQCYGHRGGAGWFWEADRGDLLIASNAHATHWMPLPEPPTGSKT